MTGVYSDEPDAVTAADASHSAESVADELAGSQLQPKHKSA